MSVELVRLICPNLKCRTILSVPSAARGKTVRCRQCGSKVAVPQLRLDPVKPAEPAPETPPSTTAA